MVVFGMPTESAFIKGGSLQSKKFWPCISTALLRREQSWASLVLLVPWLSFPPTRPFDTELKKLKFIDLFCGIGGMRLAFEAADSQCVFSSDWDKYAQKTYKENFKEVPLGNIREISTAAIPDHDILLSGFPCQPFSISGVSKKTIFRGRMASKTRAQGTLFFEIARILNDKRPQAFVLENVKHLLRHDKGRTIEVIYETLRDDLNYHVFPPLVLDASFVVPQHRERVFIVWDSVRAGRSSLRHSKIESQRCATSWSRPWTRNTR